jgi:L-ascorbate metabolism protein UlaG (beta-lactamase superfamily)
MQVTFHGHAFFELETHDGTSILVDPFMERNPLNDLSPEDFDPDVVAVTHGDAFDHAGEAHLFDAPIVCQSVCAVAYEQKGHDDARDMNVGGTMTVEGVDFRMVQAFHSLGSSNDGDMVLLADDVPITRAYGGVGAGFVIDDGETKFYHAGDTALFGDMKTVIADVYDPDVAALPIGDEVTMGPSDAAVAAGWLDVETVVPMHYDTVERIAQDPTDYADMVDSAEVAILDVGESVTV